MKWEIKHSLMLLGCILLLSCSRGGSPLCVYGDDFGDVVTKRVEVSATNPEWINTGINVENQRSLQIATLGNIELCPITKANISVSVNGANNAWTPVDMTIGSNMPWKIVSVTGTIINNPAIAASQNIDAVPATTLKNGQQLYAYVGNFLDVTEAERNNWFGKQTPVDSTENATTYNSDYFFSELHPVEIPQTGDAPPVLYQSAFRYTGKLYLRLYDHAGTQNPKAPWGTPDEYANNTGQYNVIIEYTKSCQANNGQSLQASIGKSGGMDGKIRDLSPYAFGVNGKQRGTFNDRAWADGTLWLKVVDEPKSDQQKPVGFVFGDGDYTAMSANAGSNSGTYFVNIVTTKPLDDGINKIINKIIDPIKEIMYGDPSSDDPAKYGLTKRMYLGLTGGVDFIAAVRAALVLSVIFFALSYMLGLAAVDTTKFIMYAIKVCFVVILIGPYSWTFFYNHLFSVFITGVEELIWVMSGQFADSVSKTDRFSDLNTLFLASNDTTNASLIQDCSVYKVPVIYNGSEGALCGDVVKKIEPFFILNTDPQIANIRDGIDITMNGKAGVLYDPNKLQETYNAESRNAFAFLNQTVSRFFTKETNIKIAALFSGFPLGFVYAFMIYAGMVFFLMGVLRAVVMYMLSIIMIGLLLFMAPIFITFLLFPLLRPLFDTYIKQLIGFAIQPVMIFMVLSLFNVFIYSIFYSLLSYSVCWACIWHMDLPFNDWLNITDNFDRFCIFEGYRPWGISHEQGATVQLNKFPLSLFSVLIFLILGSAMDKFLEWIVTIGQYIGAGPSVSSLGGATGNMMTGAKNTAVAAATQTVAQVKPILGFGMRQGAKFNSYMSDRAAKNSKAPGGGSGGGSGSGGALTAEEQGNKAAFEELPFSGMDSTETKEALTAGSTPEKTANEKAAENKQLFAEMAFGGDISKLSEKEEANEKRDTFLEAFGGGAFFGDTKEDRKEEKQQRQASDKKDQQKQQRRASYEQKRASDENMKGFGELPFADGGDQDDKKTPRSGISGKHVPPTPKASAGGGSGGSAGGSGGSAGGSSGSGGGSSGSGEA